MDLKELFDDLGIEYKQAGEDHHARDGWINLKCPWCYNDSYHLGFNLAFIYANCWQCGKHSLTEYLHEITHKPWEECKKLVKDLPKGLDIKAENKRGKLILPTGIEPLKKCHKDYLKSRGLNPKEIERLWSVKGITEHPNLAWRLFIPIVYRGETVSWTTRKINNKGLRYLGAKANEEKIRGKDLLYGQDYCRNSCIVVEGPLDTWAIGPGAVACLGIDYTREQVLKISKFPKRILCFDNESAAQRKAKELAKELSVFSGQTINIQIDAKDACSASKKELILLRRML